MALHVSLVGRKDLSGEVYRQLRAAIHEGRLRPGDRVPPSRELAGSLDVARMTVTVAYERLAGEGYLTARVGSGTFVSAKFPPLAVRTGRRATTGGLRHRRIWDELNAAPALSQPTFARTARFDFRSGAVDASLFPSETWRRLLRQQLRPETIGAGTYGPPAGDASLRAAISRQLALSRGVQGSFEDVTVTNGTQQALDLTARALLEPGDRVAVESPGYAPVRLLFASLGLRIEGVPVDAEGLNVSTGVQTAAEASLAVVTPGQQAPLGMTMSLPRRLALLAWARRSDAWIIEDDYLSELQLNGRAAPALASLDHGGRVLHIGSFSKTISPALRLGFIVVPPELSRRFGELAACMAPAPAAAMQRAVAELLRQGHYIRHLRRMKRLYAARREILLRYLGEMASDSIRVQATAGLAVVALLPEFASDVDIASRALPFGLAPAPLSSWYMQSPRQQGLLLGVTNLNERRLPAECRRLVELTR